MLDRLSIINFKGSCELKRLSHSQSLHKDITLHDIVSEVTESLEIVCLIISIQIPRKIGDSAC